MSLPTYRDYLNSEQERDRRELIRWFAIGIISHSNNKPVDIQWIWDTATQLADSEPK